MKPPARTTKKEILVDYREIKRALERLYGILEGISIDYELNDKEIRELFNWISLHEYLHHMEPFRSTIELLQRCLADNIIDEDEREEILDWCLRFGDKFPRTVTNAIRRLHGVLSGIVLDGKVTEDEVLGLQDFLHDYSVFKDHWPFCATWEIINQIIEDNKITEDEKEDLLNFCNNFIEQILPDAKIHDDIYSESFMASRSPVLKTFAELCDRDTKIIFLEKTFCFTGPAKTGPRKKLHEIVESFGGIPAKNVIKSLDYLVIGSQSSPCWAYSTYGRKVEAVIKNNKEGADTLFIHEDDFIDQVNLEANAP